MLRKRLENIDLLVCSSLLLVSMIMVLGCSSSMNLEEAVDHPDPAEVTHLNLGNAQWQKLPEEVMQFENLRILNLSGAKNLNVANTLQDLSKFDNLEILYLTRARMKEIPSDIGQLSNLVELYIQNNSLESLPAEIGNLDNLEKLYAFNNEITEIPPEIGRMSSLQVIRLENNRIKELPETVRNFKNLREINLSNNRFIPSEKDRIRRYLPGAKVIFEK